MTIKDEERIEKENRCIKAMRDLQVHWKNPLEDDNWDFVRGFTNNELEKETKDAVEQIRFEKNIALIGGFFKVLAVGCIILGVLGLLIFGIKQLF